jgi:hypothetical protein
MELPQYKVKRGAKFVIGMGTRVISDKKKQQQKHWCRQK